MADTPNDKTPDAIKKHKPQKTFEMKGPMGSAIRSAEANKAVTKDRARFNSDRAAKHAKMEKAKIASKEHVRDGERGRLSKEMNKSAKKEMER